MKVLYLSPVGEVGGAERVLLNLLAAVRALAPEIELGVLSAAPGPLLDEAAGLGAWVECLPMPEALAVAGEGGLSLSGRQRWSSLLRSGPRFLAQSSRYALQLRRAAAAFGADLVHSNGNKMHLLSPALPWRVPVVWHLHDLLSGRPATGRLMRLFSHRASAGIAISRAVAADAALRLKSLPVEVVLNSVDTQVFSPGTGNGAHLDFLAGLPAAAPEVVRVGLVATYARWKGQDLFLRAAAELLRSAPPVPLRFFIVGGPLYATANSQWSREELETLARSLGIAEQVGFVPFTANLCPVYRGLDLVVHASVRPEPFGLTILEAMACGRPVIASSSGGSGELFSEGEAVGLAELNEGSLARAIGELAADEPKRRALGLAARKAAVTRFSVRRMGEQVLALYARLVPAHQAKPSGAP